MIASGRNKYCIGSIPLHDLETQQILIKFQRPGYIRHFEVHVTDAGLIRYDVWICHWMNVLLSEGKDILSIIRVA